MAKSPKFWELVQRDYEINQMTYAQLVEIHKVARSSIQEKAKKEAWERNKTGKLVSDKVLLEKEKLRIKEEAGKLKPVEAEAVDSLVKHELEMAGIFQDFDKQTMQRAIKEIGAIKTGDDFAPAKLVQLSMVRKNLSPKSLELTPPFQNTTNIQNNNESINK